MSGWVEAGAWEDGWLDWWFCILRTSMILASFNFVHLQQSDIRIATSCPSPQLRSILVNRPSNLTTPLARHVDEGKSESGLLFWFEKTIRARDEKLYLMAMTCVWGKRIGLGAVRGTFASRRWLTVSWRWAAVVVLLHRLDWRQGNSNWNIM